MRRENDIVLINRKCQKILCSYKQDDLGTVDGILDEIKKAKNYLMSLIKQAAANEDVKGIGKELSKLAESKEGKAMNKDTFFIMNKI